MKLQNILFTFVGVVLMTACEKDHRNDNLVDPLVCIVNSGAQTATFYDVEETLDYNVYAFSSGYFSQPSEVKVTLVPELIEAYNAANGTAFEELDPLCYQILKNSGSISAESRRATMTVRLNCTEIMKLDTRVNYVIPLQLTAVGTEVNKNLNTILITPKMQETEVLAKNAGVVQSDLSASDADVLEFTAYTEFRNKWDSETEYEYGDAILAAYNEANGTHYLPLPSTACTFSPAQFKAGYNEAVSTIKVDKSQLAVNQYYTLAVKLKSNSKFKIGDQNTVLFHISLLPIKDDRQQWKLIKCSSYQANAAPSKMLDGDYASRWENRYSDSDGSVGDKNTLPVTMSWDMGASYYYGGVTIWRRADTYLTDLKAGYIEISANGESWTKVADFDFGPKANVAKSGTFPIEKWDYSGRYLRLTITESNRGANVSIAEFEPVLATMPKQP